MDRGNIRDSLNTLKEMILDERKLVTYVSASKEMCLHVNESKFLLSRIVEDLRKNNDSNTQLNVNYIISGLLQGNKAQTTVCNESELAALKSKFKTVFYQHLYSVSVGAPMVDNVSFMAINKFKDFPLCTGLIKNDLCIKRSSDEIGNLKTNSQELVAAGHKPNIPVQRKVKEENESNGVIEKKQVVKVHETKSEPAIKTKMSSPQKDSKNKIENKHLKTQKGIAGFFSKSASTSNKTSLASTKENTPKNNDKKEKTQKNDTKIKSEKMEVDEEIPKNPKKEIPVKVNKTISQTDKNGNKSLDQIKKNAKVDKKRKRVLHVSDSESDDEKNDPFVAVQEPVLDQESEDEIPPTPLVNSVKITSGMINPKKRRKIVDKTYTDEDGYILTKKEEVYESCSENEEDIHVKENIQHANKIKTENSPPEKKTQKIIKKKIASPQKGKQAIMTSFFKKV